MNKEDGAFGAGLIAILLIAVSAVYYFRPILHGLAMLPVIMPFIIEVAVLAVAATILVSVGRDLIPLLLGMVLYAAAGIILVAAVFFAGPLAQVEMSQQVQGNFEDISSLPEVDRENPRILPPNVAEEYADNSLQTPRYELGTSDIAVGENGTPYWSMPKVPDGLVNTITIKQEGASYVNMTTQGKKIKYTDDKMQIGQGMLLRDGLGWNLLKEKYWLDYKDPVNLEHDGKNYIAVPMVKYNWHMSNLIAYSTPEYEGVALVNPEGEISYLSPEEASSHEVLQDQRLYPYDVARYKVSSMEYKQGILNAWFTHKNQLEVADVPGYDNEQPFTVFTEEDGVQLLVATEPYGNAQGLFEIWIFDGQTGDIERYALNRSEGLIGPAKALNYVEKANSRVNWGRGEAGGFDTVEPVPVLLDDKLYWQVTVIPESSAGISFTSYVDAQSGDVINAESDREIREFLEDREVSDTSPPVDRGNSSEDGVETVEVQVLVDGEVVHSYTLDNPSNFSVEDAEVGDEVNQPSLRGEN